MVRRLFSSKLNDELYGVCDIKEYENGHLQIEICKKTPFTGGQLTCESFIIPPTFEGLNEVETIVSSLRGWLDKNKNEMLQTYKEETHEFT